MPRFRETVPIDDYVLDVLMRDIVGHDRQPAAYLVYLYLYGQAARSRWKPVPIELAHARGSDWPVEERCANRARNFTSARTDRGHHQRSRHRRAGASRAAALETSAVCGLDERRVANKMDTTAAGVLRVSFSL